MFTWQFSDKELLSGQIGQYKSKKKEGNNFGV